MKTYNNLYQNLLNIDNIKTAIYTASQGKTKRVKVLHIVVHAQEAAEALQKKIQNMAWTPSVHSKNKLKEGSHAKERLIEKPSFFDEQIMHHLLMQDFQKIVIPKMYEYSCGSIPGRGTLSAMKAIKKWRNQLQKQYKNFYVAELDIKKFYQNIDINILKNQLNKLIKDKKYLSLLFKVIDTSSPGLPLGFYTSPWLGNWYLTPLDREIIHNLKPSHYLRYMDNLYLFHPNKEELHRMVQQIKEFSEQQLHLEIKQNWQVYRFETKDENNKYTGRPINCLGFVIHCDRVGIRKSILKRIRTKFNKMYKNKQYRCIDVRTAVSYSGWLQHSDTYSYYFAYLKPKVSLTYCKKRIRNISKKEAKRREEKYDRLVQSLQLRPFKTY